MPRDHRSFEAFLGFLTALSLAGSSAAIADDERPAATPYRPTVSTPATLSAPGWVEGEFGGLVVRNRASDDGPSTRASVPYAFKYAFTDDWGVRVDGEAVVHTDGNGSQSTGFGDTGFVLKRRFAIDDAHAFGLEVGALYPTARPALRLGSGKPDYSANAIYSADVAGWHGDFNLIETRFGARNDETSRWLTTGALAVSHPLTDNWQAAVEWSGGRETGAPGTAQILGALSCSLRRWLVVDFGGVHGLNRATPRWQAFAGATVVIGRLD